MTVDQETIAERRLAKIKGKWKYVQPTAKPPKKKVHRKWLSKLKSLVAQDEAPEKAGLEETVLDMQNKSVMDLVHEYAAEVEREGRGAAYPSIVNYLGRPSATGVVQWVNEEAKR